MTNELPAEPSACGASAKNPVDAAGVGCPSLPLQCHDETELARVPFGSQPWHRSSQVWLFGLLFLHAIMLIRSTALNSPTIDEPFHIAGGVRHWTDGKFDIDRGNPPLVGMVAAMPVVLVGAETDWSRAPNSFLVGGDFLKANGPRSFWLVTIARWAVLPFSLWGAWLCFVWARELSDERSGLLAAVQSELFYLLEADGLGRNGGSAGDDDFFVIHLALPAISAVLEPPKPTEFDRA